MSERKSVREKPKPKPKPNNFEILRLLASREKEFIFINEPYNSMLIKGELRISYLIPDGKRVLGFLARGEISGGVLLWKREDFEEVREELQRGIDEEWERGAGARAAEEEEEEEEKS